MENLVQSAACPQLDRLAGGDLDLREAQALGGGESAEDMLLRRPRLTRIADADPQARIPIGAELVVDRGQSVVATGAPTLAEPQRAEGEAEIVDDHEQRRERDARRELGRGDGRVEGRAAAGRLRLQLDRVELHDHAGRAVHQQGDAPSRRRGFFANQRGLRVGQRHHEEREAAR